MSIYSVGVDITQVERIQELIQRHEERFLKRVFTAREIAYCQPKAIRAQCFAGRFAVKEAVFKAAGTGLRTGMSWQDVEVINDELGRPSVYLHGATARLFEGKRIHLSLSHEGTMAIAMVVVEEVL
ncbi:MAG: holo-ACP synthase [Calditrichaceae bacterium]|nr:holo-ACP synthase [Calditrichia bacterium]NUQ43875.1 holo-ACP synthase [Calditrichaceae bacterium]